jgi:hypothetical protein
MEKKVSTTRLKIYYLTALKEYERWGHPLQRQVLKDSIFRLKERLQEEGCQI